MAIRAKTAFWLDGGYDFDCVKACSYHPFHSWWTFRLGDVVEFCYDPDEFMTICRGCFVPRCGTGEDTNRCIMWRHHTTDHILEDGQTIPMGV